MPTHDEMVRVVERYVEAFDHNDPEMVVALFAADGTVEDPVGTPAHKGTEAIRAFYTRSMKSTPKLTLEGPVRTAADFAAFAFSVRLNFGGEKKIDVIDTFRFNEEGKVVEMRAYFSPQNMQGFD
ncbi:nuclear transport factor 2 family protein [Sphingomonas sp. C3-2]|uniref:nuclear transport factor 2 family protein n=1 Tax=Sphingomonas sp. C3-2 TaxID=3062169 RepID=UPI00294AB395|nr:nuclear transport factor 2 family protein [Sphingomonas sp. C3-2]WOK37441.1 nuclear transport factor 2 family protein [Sphingomonas sp. C3-2]